MQSASMSTGLPVLTREAARVDWCRNFLDHAGPGGCEPFILVARKRGAVSAILPLAVQSRHGMRVLTGLSEPFQQYSDMLADRGCDLPALMREMLPLFRAAGADSLHFGQMRVDSDLHKAASGIVPVSGEADGAPFVPIGDWPDFADYHKTVNAKTRKNMRNARNRLERDGPVTNEIARSGGLLAEVIDRSFHGRESWLERQGLTSRAFREQDFAAFIERFKQPEKTGIATIAFSLKHGGRPIADQWGFIHKRRYYAFMARWDESYEEFSPGKMQLGAILESCHAEGIDVADFLIPATRYKFTWARDAVAVQDHVLPLTLRGKAHNAVWLNFTRPLAKRMMESMPPRLRSRLLRTVLKSLPLVVAGAAIAANLTLPAISA